MSLDPDSWWVYALLVLAAFGAGVVNSIAGGGTLLTFPALTLILDAQSANITSTIALLPGSIAGAWAFRRELSQARQRAILLFWPSLIGGIIGASLLIALPGDVFRVVVPWLILTATLLFLSQPLIAEQVGIGRDHGPPTWGMQAGIIVFQLLVAIYGGYFGAGIGILMLSALALMGMSDLVQMNAVKTFLAALINGVSAVVFLFSDSVVWHYALVMAISAIAGGYCGAVWARKLPRLVVRWTIIALGLILSVYYLLK
jgi:uncharacterized membrane protein YfcA